MTRSSDNQITLVRCLGSGPFWEICQFRYFFVYTSIRMSHSDKMHLSPSSDSTFYTMGDITEFWAFFQTIHNLPLEMSLHLSIFFERKVHFLVDGFFLGLNLLQVLCKCACHLFLAHVHFLGFEFFQQFFCRHWFSHQISANCLLCYSSTTEKHIESISISQ